MNASLNNLLLTKKIEYLKEQVVKARINEISNMEDLEVDESKDVFMILSHYNDILLILDMIILKKYDQALSLFNTYSLNKRTNLIF